MTCDLIASRGGGGSIADSDIRVWLPTGSIVVALTYDGFSTVMRDDTSLGDEEFVALKPRRE